MRITITSILFILILAYGALVFASSSGITGVTKKNGNGCDCHGTPSVGVTVSIMGPDTLAVNQSATYILTIRGGPAIRGGTNISVSNGGLRPISPRLQLLGDELTHKEPTPFGFDGTLSFPFEYSAPAIPGTQILFAAGNSVNFNNNPTGDQWNFAPNKNVVVRTVISSVEEQMTSLPVEFSLAQNYPNPFNPDTNFEFQLARAGLVSLRLYDLSGKEVATVIHQELSAGRHRVQWNAGPLASGVYVYRLQVGPLSESKKLVLMK